MPPPEIKIDKWVLDVMEEEGLSPKESKRAITRLIATKVLPPSILSREGPLSSYGPDRRAVVSRITNLAVTLRESKGSRKRNATVNEPIRSFDGSGVVEAHSHDETFQRVEREAQCIRAAMPPGYAIVSDDEMAF